MKNKNDKRKEGRKEGRKEERKEERKKERKKETGNSYLISIYLPARSRAILFSFSLAIMPKSTRRFCCLPSAVSLEATG